MAKSAAVLSYDDTTERSIINEKDNEEYKTTLNYLKKEKSEIIEKGEAHRKWLSSGIDLISKEIVFLEKYVGKMAIDDQSDQKNG